MADWPIRDGGEYYPLGASEHRWRSVVIAVDEDIVYSRMRSVTPVGQWGFVHGEIRKDPSWSFRAMYAPEDQSPIPALVEALKSFIALENDWDYKPFIDAVSIARAALAKAGAK